MEIVVVLDRSGSMTSAKSDHEGGLNSFISDQKSKDAKFTLVQFDSENPFEILYDGVDISDVGDVHLFPRGGTPLVEAVTRTILHVKERLLKQDKSPVIVMVVTDGQENASHSEYSNENLKKLIKECESDNWVFMYLGANVDEFDECSKMGFSHVTSAGFSNQSGCVQDLYSNISQKMSRACSFTDMNDIKACYNFTDEERKEFKSESISNSSNSQSN